MEERVSLAGGVLQTLADPDEQFVTSGMPYAGVDSLELVQIDVQESDIGVISSGLFQAVLQAVFEKGPVGQSGQRMVVFTKIEFLLQRSDASQIAQDPDELILGPAAGQRFFAHKDRSPGTVSILKEEFSLPTGRGQDVAHERLGLV